jgi:hypothetical protein
VYLRVIAGDGIVEDRNHGLRDDGINEFDTFFLIVVPKIVMYNIEHRIMLFFEKFKLDKLMITSLLDIYICFIDQ